MYYVSRQQGQDAATTQLTTIEEIMDQIHKDFGSKVILKTAYTPVNEASQTITNNDLSSITTLSNGDQILINFSLYIFLFK